jgi:NADH-quinone oxidoreductase subunit G
MPKCNVDGREIEVESGTTIIQAAERLGIHVPHFCYHPDLPVDGNCRMCLVEIEGVPKLQIACNTQVTDGMVVKTRSENAAKAQRSTLELLLINHPIDCPVCDQAGECYLQNEYMNVGLHDARVSIEEKVRKRKVVDLGPIVLDQERCVLCSRCLRFEREVTKTNSLEFRNRGDHTEIASFEDRPITHDYAGNLAEVCPVGALLSRDFRFKMRVWFLESTESVCPGCSTGCNVLVDHRDGEVHRIRPRRNVEVNRSWMCDHGRALYREIGLPSRLTGAWLKEGGGARPVPLATALDTVARALETAGPRAAFVATPQATNEDLLVFRALAERAGGLLDFRVGDPHLRLRTRVDEVLLRADKNPNTQGCLDQGLARDGVSRILEACLAGEIRTLVLQGPELLERPEAMEALARVSFVAVLAVHDVPALQSAHAALPAATWAEADGTFTNFDGRVQRIRRAVPPPDEARPRWELAEELLRRLGAPLGTASAREVFAHLSRSVPGYEGLDYRAIGMAGVRRPGGTGA